MTTVAAAIRAALMQRNPRAKAMATRAVARDWRLGRLDPAFDVAMPDAPGRPDRPELLAPRDMPKRGRGQSTRGRIALWHSLAHIDNLDLNGRNDPRQQCPVDPWANRTLVGGSL